MRRALPLIALASLAFAPLPLPRPRPDTTAHDLKALRGEWVLVRQTVNGRPFSLGGQTTLAVVGNRMRYAYDGRPTREWEFLLDGKPSPTRLDREEVGFPGNGLRRGIYRIEGDTLTISSRNGDRPMGFDGKGDGVIFEVFKRARP